MNPTRPLPGAILGLAVTPDGRGMLRVCAWCPKPDKEAAERVARAWGFQVTHGICEACAGTLEAGRLESPGITHA
jgi:hypothetical protein